VRSLLSVVRAIGIDVCDVGRLGRALEGAHGRRLCDRLFTEAERAYCDARGVGRVASYAARFAAKEAVAKALGTGIGAALAWREVEVVRLDDTPPALRLGPRARALAAERGIAHWHLSLSHAAGVAVAMVVAEDAASGAPPVGDAAGR
jgi:holo-[acyl-carrier protein] synthase